MAIKKTRSFSQSLFSLNRRAFMGQYAGAIGSLALAHLLELEHATAAKQTGPTRPTEMGGSLGGNRKAQARSVICLFQHGGPSQMDLFDPKGELIKHQGKPFPGQLEIHFDKQAGNLLASPFKFQPHGQSGMVVSELVPHLSGIVDDLTLVRS